MDTITLFAQIGQDHRLVLQLPPDMPLGQVEVTIRLSEPSDLPIVNLIRQAAREKLLAAGRLVTDIHASNDTVLLSDEELRHLIIRPIDTPSLDEMIDEDRGLQ